MNRENAMTVYSKTIPSPVGALTLTASDKGLQRLEFKGGRHNDDHPVLKKAVRQLEEYFAGKRRAFDVPLDPQGTPFQLKAWRELSKIPYGATISYGEQAKRIGDVRKARPIGQANGKNPISIIVPCHRVIGASGKLTGYGGGLRHKQFLLDLERRHSVAEKLAA